MTIGLANSAKHSRYSGSITNEFQGGGNKKAGLPNQVGFNYLVPIYRRERGIPRTLPFYQDTVFPLANISRPIGRNYNQPYWQIPGTLSGRDGQPGL